MPREYRINPEDDFVTPEETLLDSGSSFSDTERPVRPGMFRGMFWGIAFLMGIIFSVSAKFSIAEYGYYSNLALQNRSANFTLPAARGIIFDSAGRPLVKNVPQFDVVAVAKDVKAAMKNNTLDVAKLSAALVKDPEEINTIFNVKLREEGIFFLATNLDKEQILAVRSMSTPGIYVISDVKRIYIDGPDFSTILGYIGKVNKEDLASNSYYNSTDTIGRLGIEAEYEPVLQGVHGRIFFGDTANDINVAAKNGDNVVLNINGDLQRRLYNELHGILASAGLSRGAAIIQNPQSGAVLAMVSLPGFDNNQFIDGLSQKEYSAIFQSSARPLFNRVISGLYNPGSTIKPLIGLMGLEEHVITPGTTIQDCISISIPNPYNPDDIYTFNNWRHDLGLFNLRRSIANSCNIFFATVGGGFGNIAGLGVTKMVQYFKNSFADKILGIDLPSENHGFVPTPDWKLEARSENWYQGDTYNISIGQGDLTVSPLWLNAYVSAIALAGQANGGTVYQPLVAGRIVDGEKNTLQTIVPKIVGKLPFSDKNLAVIKDDMRETILSGTASLLKDLPVTAGAKTGTAQVVNGQKINSLFTIFAPYDHPQIAMTILVENPTGEGLAIRTANNVLKWYFGQAASGSH